MVNISLDEWVMEEIVMPGSKGNRSARIQELIIKGHIYEKEHTVRVDKSLYSYPFEKFTDFSPNKILTGGRCADL